MAPQIVHQEGGVTVVGALAEILALATAAKAEIELHDTTASLEAIQQAVEPGACVLGPHLPGWPLVTYKGSQRELHGPARVVEAYSRHGASGMEFRLVIVTDNPAQAPLEQRVLENVRLQSIAPLQP